VRNTTKILKKLNKMGYNFNSKKNFFTRWNQLKKWIATND
jgi:hypothetical protein